MKNTYYIVQTLMGLKAVSPAVFELNYRTCVAIIEAETREQAMLLYETGTR